MLIEGAVFDKTTNKAIPYVHVFIQGQDVGTTTNSQGEFQLKVPQQYKKQNLSVSFIGYKSQSFLVSDIAKEPLKVLLESDPVLLSEVKITPADALAIIYEAIEKIPINYNMGDHSVTGFQREIITDDGNYIQILEADFVSTRKGNKTTAALLGGKYAEDKMRRENDNLWKDKRGGFYTFGFTGLSGMILPAQNSFLGTPLTKDEDFSSYYDFTLNETVSFEDRELYVLQFDQKDNIKKALAKGTIYIDKQSLAFVKLSYELSPKGINYIKTNQTWEGKPVSTAGGKKIKLKNEKYQYSYRKYGDKWYLDSYVMEADFDASLKMVLVNLAKKENMYYRSESVITNIDTVSVPALSPTVAPSEFYYFQVYLKNNYENYDAAAWEKFTSLRSDTSYSEVVKQLKINNARVGGER